MSNGKQLPTLLTRPEAAKALHVGLRTLDRWHTERIGPPRFPMGGKVVYDMADLADWIDAQKAKAAA